jgi:hypothetical protein
VSLAKAQEALEQLSCFLLLKAHLDAPQIRKRRNRERPNKPSEELQSLSLILTVAYKEDDS